SRRVPLELNHARAGKTPAGHVHELSSTGRRIIFELDQREDRSAIVRCLISVNDRVSRRRAIGKVQLPGTLCILLVDEILEHRGAIRDAGPADREHQPRWAIDRKRVRAWIENDAIDLYVI